MSRPFQEERNSQDLWMGLGMVSEVVSVRRCAKSVKPKARDPPAVESGQPDEERAISASNPLAPTIPTRPVRIATMSRVSVGRPPGRILASMSVASRLPALLLLGLVLIASALLIAGYGVAVGV